MNVVIRKATVHDIETIYEIEKKCFEESDRFEKNYFYLFLLGRRGEVFLVAEEIISNTVKLIVGFIIACINKKMNFEILTLNVDPNFQRKGIGTLLMTKIEEIIITKVMKHLKVHSITLELIVYEKNLPAIHLYQKLGFEEIARIPNYYPKSRNGIKMQKILNTFSMDFTS